MRVNDVYGDWLTNGGIFSDMMGLQGVEIPWASDNTALNLDMIYHGNHSGNKNISPLVATMLKTDNTALLTTTRRTQIATTIYQMFIDKWTKLYQTLSFEYNPISNYDMTETESSSGTTGGTRTNTGTQTDANTGTQTDATTGTETTTHTGTQTNATTGTETTAHTGTQGTSETNSVTGSGSSSSGIYGFNSSTAVDDSETSTSTTNSGTGSSTRTDNLEDETTHNTTDARTDNLEDETTHGTSETRTDNLLHTRTDNLTETDSGTHSETRTLTRSGNIGVTTSQQMIQSERDLQMFNVFYDGVFSDIDKVLSIATY